MPSPVLDVQVPFPALGKTAITVYIAAVGRSGSTVCLIILKYFSRYIWVLSTVCLTMALNSLAIFQYIRLRGASYVNRFTQPFLR